MANSVLTFMTVSLQAWKVVAEIEFKNIETAHYSNSFMCITLQLTLPIYSYCINLV